MAAPRQLEIWPTKPLTFRQRKALIQSRLRGLEYRQASRAERRRRENARRRGKERERLQGLVVGPRQITIFGLTDPPPRSPRANREFEERNGGFS